MLSNLTGDDLFAEILMLRTSDARTVVLLEGSSDCSALDPHMLEETSRSLPGYSKSAVERAIELVDESSIERVLGILDRDWVGLVESPMVSPNVVYTDLYDLDATIILGGDVLDRLLSSLADRDQLAGYLQRMGTTARELFIRLAGQIGLGRFVARRDRLKVRFQRFPVHSCTDARVAVVDIATMSAVAISKSKAPACTEIELASKIRKAVEEEADLERFCSGHDLAALISHLIRKEWGGARVSRDVVEKTARAAFDRGNLRRTQLYEQVKDWAAAVDTEVWKTA
jgi:hypothetical protein